MDRLTIGAGRAYRDSIKISRRALVSLREEGKEVMESVATICSVHTRLSKLLKSFKELDRPGIGYSPLIPACVRLRQEDKNSRQLGNVGNRVRP